MADRRLLLFALLALGAGALTFTQLRSGSRPDAARRAPAPQPHPTTAPRPAPSPRPPTRATAEHTPPRTPGTDPVAIYRQQAVYPPDSRPLTPRRRDLIEWNRRYERPTRRMGGGTVLLTADRYWITDDAPLQVTLETWDESSRPVPPRIRGATLRVGESARPVVFRFDGARALAHLAPATWRVDAPVIAHVEVETIGLDGRTERDAIRAAYTPPAAAPARFSETLEDSVVDGSLWVDVGVEVRVPGRYLIDANLYDVAGEPIAFARFKGRLEVGEGSAPLRFFGRALREHGQPGPYRVGELRGRLYRPDDPVDLVPVAPAKTELWTGSYALEAFSDAAWDSPRKRAKLARLEALRDGPSPRVVEASR